MAGTTAGVGIGSDTIATLVNVVNLANGVLRLSSQLGIDIFEILGGGGGGGGGGGSSELLAGLMGGNEGCSCPGVVHPLTLLTVLGAIISAIIFLRQAVLVNIRGRRGKRRRRKRDLKPQTAHPSQAGT